MSAIFNVGNRIMNTYVYNTSAGYIMVDTGYEHSLASVERKLEKHGINISDIKYVFLTHAHDDHAGFLNEYKKCFHEYSKKARNGISTLSGCNGDEIWFIMSLKGEVHYESRKDW